jgi:hypothetical protein
MYNGMELDLTERKKSRRRIYEIHEKWRPF